ncbi:MAG TPA: hypothetical protein VFC03_23065, partial [Acidimicrobiales bacterium]|nr:hypothetical protein [Acidimicrobiales bacterium]
MAAADVSAWHAYPYPRDDLVAEGAGGIAPLANRLLSVFSGAEKNSLISDRHVIIARPANVNH